MHKTDNLPIRHNDTKFSNFITNEQIPLDFLGKVLQICHNDPAKREKIMPPILATMFAGRPSEKQLFREGLKKKKKILEFSNKKK